jgi:hypothetical protein
MNTLRWKQLQLAFIHLHNLFGLRTANRLSVSGRSKWELTTCTKHCQVGWPPLSSRWWTHNYTSSRRLNATYMTVLAVSWSSEPMCWPHPDPRNQFSCVQLSRTLSRPCPTWQYQSSIIEKLNSRLDWVINKPKLELIKPSLLASGKLRARIARWGLIFP